MCHQNQNAGCLLIPARRASPHKHLWLLVAMGWTRVSARDTAAVLTPVFQSCALAPFASRRDFSSLHSSHHVCGQTSFCLGNTVSGLGEPWFSVKSQVFWKEAAVLRELSASTVWSPLSPWACCSPRSESGKNPCLSFVDCYLGVNSPRRVRAGYFQLKHSPVLFVPPSGSGC